MISKTNNKIVKFYIRANKQDISISMWTVLEVIIILDVYSSKYS